MRSRFLLLGLFAGLILFAFALWVYVDQAAADDPIAQRLAILKQRGVKVQTTPRSAPFPAGVTVLPTPPPVDDDALRPSPDQRPPLSPRVSGPCKNDPGLFKYIGERAQALEQMQSPESNNIFHARVNLRRPLGEAEMEKLVSEYNLRVMQLYYVTNSDASGSFCYHCDTLAGTQARLREHVDERLIAVGYAVIDVSASLDDLRRLNRHAQALLVDPARLKELPPGSLAKYQSFFADPIFWRYEQACR